MTNPFTAFAFAATGSPTSRTLPNRLAEIINVRDFGAVGDGVTDDWAAIMAAVNWTASVLRGMVFFPPGTYKVSAPIDWSPYSISSDFYMGFTGVFGSSTVVGNFNEYVFKRGINDTAGNSGGHTIENLTIINNHATGGGIRIGYCVGAAVRNCIVTANHAINTASIDSGGSITSQEVAIINCTVSPGSNPSGSLGINTVSDGPIANCSITGFDLGVKGYGQTGCQSMQGCRVEQCVTGVTGVARIAGCVFRNCGTAILSGTSCVYSGIRIEGTEGAGRSGSHPQYGIQMATDGGKIGVFCGISISGQFEKYGVEVVGGEAFAMRANFIGMQVTNTSTLGGLPWHLPSTAGSAQYIGCNVAPVFTMSGLPAFPVSISSISWAGGTTTVVLGAGNMNQYFPNFIVQVNVVSVTPSGYNGVFSNVTVTAFNTLTYPQTNPGSPTGTGGAITIMAGDANGLNVLEGEDFSVRDASTATWGAIPAGGGATHAKVRWSGLNWTVMGV